MISPKRPNVVWIFCDELRTDALGCYGPFHPVLRTPHIDGLAERGVVFENCFVNSPVCVSSRVAMHTGLLPEQTGVYHNEATWPVYPSRSFPTFPEALAAAGYATADFGKEHLPKAMQPWQLQNPDGGGILDIFEEIADPEALELVRSPAGGVVSGRFPSTRRYPPTRVVDNTLAWVATATKPFLVRASFLQPHSPVVPPDPWSTRYDPDLFPDEVVVGQGISAFERRFGELCDAMSMPPAHIALAHARYHGMVSWIDSEVGRLLAGLRTLGAADDTIVVFTADHGHLLGENGAIGKQTFQPQSQRIPLVISGPGIAPGRRDDLAQGIDFPRTFCGLAGVAAPEGAGGRDLLADGRAPDHVFATIGYGERTSYALPNLRLGRFGEQGWPRRSCVRTDRWRLDRTVRIDGRPAAPEEWDVFLTDWRLHPYEGVNLADDPAFAAVRDDLLKVLDERQAGAAESPAELVEASQ